MGDYRVEEKVMGTNVSKFEERVIREIGKSHTVKVTGVEMAGTFYVRIRRILRERNVGRAIKGAVRDNVVYFWLYGAYRSVTLTKNLQTLAVEIKYPKDGITTEDIIMEERALNNAFSFTPEWADEIEDSNMKQPVIHYFISLLKRVEEGEMLVSEFKHSVDIAEIGVDNQAMLIRKVDEEIDQRRIANG